MIVLILSIKEDGQGFIQVYEVDKSWFKRVLRECAPEGSGDWTEIKGRIMDKGTLLYFVCPDYSFRVEI